eukprot:2279337-Rhodomonas_salina.1
MAAGDLNNDDKTDLIINTKNSVAYILWGQDHANNFTTIEGSQAPVVVTNGDTTPICIQAKLLNDNWQGACGYMDLSNESSDHFASLINTGQISKVTLGGGSAHELAVIGDINKDSLSDMAYVDGATLQIIPGKCNDHGDSCVRSKPLPPAPPDCGLLCVLEERVDQTVAVCVSGEKQPNLPPGCKMDLARLLVSLRACLRLGAPTEADAAFLRPLRSDSSTTTSSSGAEATSATSWSRWRRMSEPPGMPTLIQENATDVETRE